MKNNWKKILTFSRALTIIFAIYLTFTLIYYNSTYYSDESFDTIYILIIVGCGGTFLFTMLWLLSNDKITNEDRFSEEERKIEDEKKKQQYEEISDIWEYGEKAMLAVVPSQSDETRGTIHYIELKCTNIDSTPWIITISNSDGLSEEFKATRKGNTFIGLKDEKIAIMKKGQLIIDDKIFYFSTENESVKNVSVLIKELLNGEKIETIRFEHMKAAGVSGEDVIDALPKFHFSFTEEGLKCDEINYPQNHLEDFFKKNNGNEYVFQNKVFYMEYCKNNGLYNFNAFQEREFQAYMHNLHMQAIKSGYTCKTDFSLSEWQVSIRHGAEKLFNSFKSYVEKKTLDIVPSVFTEKTIYFCHKHYSPRNNETMLFHNLAIASMEMERINNPPKYFVSKTDNGRILFNINGESFVSVKKVN